MNKSKLLLGLGATLPIGYATNANAQEEHPNVIIILADDLGYGDLQPYGATSVNTPAVNRLASEGLMLTNMHATASVSTPSRYSLLTGEYAWRRKDTGIATGDAQMIIRPSQYTLADMFKNAGYTTAAVGKWHLGLGDKTGEQDWNAPLPSGLQDIGFDYHYIMAATGDRVPCVFIENNQVANYDSTAPISVSYRNPFPNEPLGRTNPELLYNLKASHGHDMAIVNGIGRIGYMKGGGTALWQDENIADSITHHACQFIRSNKDNPFFLYFCTNDIHVPRFPHDRFRGKNPMGYRGDAIEQFDWSVNQILQTLDSLGIADNTLLILTSDNGPVVDDGYADRAVELLGSHKPAGSLRGNKYGAFEGGTTVPTFIRWPKMITEPKTINTLQSHIDFFASLQAMLNVRIPKGSAKDSQNNWQTLIGKSNNDRAYIIEQSISTLSVKTSEWKYIEPSFDSQFIAGPDVETGNSPEPQLYNIRKDPSEKNNLALKHPEIVFQMQQILRKER